MDLLSDILDSLSLQGQFYFSTCFSGPWSIGVPTHPAAIRFHYALQGECYVRAGDARPVHLRQGDMVLIPAGASHAISDTPERKPVELETVLQDAGYTGTGTLIIGEGCEHAATQLMCGHFSFADGSDHPLLRSLPDIIHVSASLRSSTFWLDEALRLMARQMADANPGSMAVVRRMSEIIFIETVRSSASQSPELAGLMEALSDPRISRAIAAMHRDVASHWTVEALASEAAMSRSRFAARFQELVGCGPLTYLAEWRLQKARGMLREGRISVQEVAGRIGYQSPAAFTRAFANMFGESPSSFRARPAA
ncbi:AraC family transcriptional regulator [Erythrobacter sp. JK5]|uniref:AraC family transcriptional regulator n=1 Tax=Erythrobacter sp. JK5 TaxID=2829500 RepID=UPI001BAB0B29|nr:AraC family transcriptional regulator [Erythrobacter sp. JK5]QUL38982.1 AraC family transcriptional regulator [Erythrobacter sp. JK5]